MSPCYANLCFFTAGFVTHVKERRVLEMAHSSKNSPGYVFGILYMSSRMLKFMHGFVSFTHVIIILCTLDSIGVALP